MSTRQLIRIDGQTPVLSSSTKPALTSDTITSGHSVVDQVMKAVFFSVAISCSQGPNNYIVTPTHLSRSI